VGVTGRLAIAMTLIVIGGCIFFIRRQSPEVAYVTSVSDYAILLLTQHRCNGRSLIRWFDVRLFTLLHSWP
jgi:nitrate reductase gamma subunit